MAPVEWYGSFIYGECVPYAPGIYLSSVLGKDTTRQFLLWFKVQGRSHEFRNSPSKKKTPWSPDALKNAKRETFMESSRKTEKRSSYLES